MLTEKLRKLAKKFKNLIKLYSIFFNKPFKIALNSLTWSLINNLLGILLGSFSILFFDHYLQNHDAALVIKLKNFKNYNFGLALGRIIIASENLPKITLKHEIGHFRQSLILGPLYFLFIGIPSLIRASFFVYNSKWPMRNYYYFYTEAWADALGGVYELRNHKFDKWWKYILKAFHIK